MQSNIVLVHTMHKIWTRNVFVSRHMSASLHANVCMCDHAVGSVAVGIVVVIV